MAWRCTAREEFDDDHAPAAARTRMRERLVVLGEVGGLVLWLWSGEQVTGARDIGGARGFGEQAIVAYAVEAVRQHVDEEAADEVVGCERHTLVAISTFDAIVLPPEGDAPVVEPDQSAVRDGDAVGVARQIGAKALAWARRVWLPKNASCLWAAASRCRNRRRKRRESTRTGRKKPGRQETQREPSSEMPPPGTIMCTCG